MSAWLKKLSRIETPRVDARQRASIWRRLVDASVASVNERQSTGVARLYLHAKQKNSNYTYFFDFWFLVIVL